MHDDDNLNPYLSPKTESISQEIDSDFEVIRREHLSHEASIQSIGLLYLLMGIFCTIAFISFLVSLVPAATGQRQFPEGDLVFVSINILLIGLLMFVGFYVGYGLRTLNPSVRMLAIITSAVGLLGFPIGTIINGYALWLVGSKKGAYILSPAYKQVIAATPHIKYRTSIIVWIFVGLLLIVIALGVVGALFALIGG